MTIEDEPPAPKRCDETPWLPGLPPPPPEFDEPVSV